jgi:hypothetical protein
LDDPCWKTATYVQGFYRYGGGGDPSKEQTELWLCADNTHLYVFFHCLDSHPDLIKAYETQRNGNINMDDNVGMDIDSQGTHHGYSSFLVSARGTQVEYLEGGTADNITWAGDWKAAVQRSNTGWTCEFSIPFALMRYPRGTTAISMVLYRKLARETSLQSWPYMPPAGVDGSTEPQYMDTFDGISPTYYAPRPIFLPYTLATAGDGSAVRNGLDIKYPLSTAMTGVVSFFPDFETIEQSVTSINFSYTSKYLSDNRPFFAEGSSFFPYSDLFYSRAIGEFDEGIKVVGKDDGTTLGILATNATGQSPQNTAVMNLKEDLGPYSDVLLDYVSDNQMGLPSNRTAKFEGVYGWEVGQTRMALQADHLPSWVDDKEADSKDYFSFSNTPEVGQPRYGLNYTDIGPHFVSDLGYVPETDLKGWAGSVGEYNQFDRGPLQNYSLSASASSYQHHTIGFFHSDVNVDANALTRNGLYYEMTGDMSSRNQADSTTDLLDKFHDHVVTGNFGWGQLTLFQQGYLSENFGNVSGQRYNFVNLQQGLQLLRPLTAQIAYYRLDLGATSTTQVVATGTYRITNERTVGARVVYQSGATDVYVSFSQQVRSGTDVFLLFGDPNSSVTREIVTLKLVRPF